MPALRSDAEGRDYLAWHMESFSGWPVGEPLASPHFVLFVAPDAKDVAFDDLTAAAGKALLDGAVYVCAWGPDCERVHDAFDHMRVELDLEHDQAQTRLTTWHSEESSEEALWFWMNTVRPADAFEPSCRTWVAVSVGDIEVRQRIEGYLRDPRLLDRAVGL